MKRAPIFVIALLLFSEDSKRAWAYSEMIRNGYVNCTSCHVSPTGGGLLTTYGRALSKEVLSKGRFFFEKSSKSEAKTKAMAAQAPSEGAGSEGEEAFLYGSVGTPGWLNFGGDIRLFQYFLDTPKISSARFILMQADLEAMAEYRRFRILGTFGRQEPPPGVNANSISDYVISRRHWVGALLGPETTPDLVQIRIGKFFPAYGLYVPEHTTVIRRGLGFDQNRETYNAEVSYVAEQVNVFGTAIFGGPTLVNEKRESGGTLQVSTSIAQSFRIGINGYTGKIPDSPESSRRNLTGAFGAMGFTSYLYALVEADVSQSTGDGFGGTDYVKLGWEIDPGLHLFASQEYQKRSFSRGNSIIATYTGGIQYFPRPHWEFLGALAKQQVTQASSDFNSAIWFLIHYYL